MSTNMFLLFSDSKYEKELKGESEDEKHAEWIEVVSWNHSFEQPPTNFRTSTGSTVEKCKHENLSITKYLDVSSAALLKCVWGGKQIEKANLVCYRADSAAGDNIPIEYLNIELEKVVISTYSISGGEGDIPQEELGLSYGTIKYLYIPKNKLTGAKDDGKKKSAKVSLISNKIE